jgi:PKD repeat protein
MLFGFTYLTNQKPFAMKRIITILPLLSLLVISCHREPFADATASLNPAYVGETVRFTSHSTNYDYLEWDMDDGITYSTPIVDHYFIDPGFYDVTLSAFGKHGGVSTAVIPMEVLGAKLTVEVREYYDEYLVPNASVRLYPTLTDWENETNMVAEGFTNSSGQVTFDNLSYQIYYVDVWEAFHNNYQLASEDVGFIMSPLLDDDYIWIAYVDYYPNGAKSAATGERPPRNLKAAPAGEGRTSVKNVTKIPRERK